MNRALHLLVPESSRTLTEPRERWLVAAAPVPPSAFEEFLARRRFSALDGIRALSILAVIWHHTAAGAGGVPLSSNGFLGVDMFFVLSGFLIVTLLLRERARTGDVSLLRFYKRRTLRIFPIWYLVLFCVLVFVTLVRPASGMRAPFLHELPFHLSYTTNWIRSTTFLAIAWSLATEEQFYLVWPPLEKLFARGAVLVLLCVIALNQLINFGALDGFLEHALGLKRADYAILQVTFTPICLGVLLAHVLDRPAGFQRLYGWFSSHWTLWAVLAALLVACNLPGDIAGLPRLSIQVLMALFLAGCVLDEGHSLASALAWRPLAWIGAISYGMYIYHHFARHAAELALRKGGIDSRLALFAACTAVTIAIAAASFRWIETPLSRLKGR